MAETTRGSGIRTDVSSRSPRAFVPAAKYNKIAEFGAGDYYLSGSNGGSQGFIVQTAGTTVLHPVEGAPINASAINAKEVYEIGLSRITGSGTVSVLY